MQQRSREKVEQVMNLAKTLHLNVEARQRVNKATGFIENIVFWNDVEKYPEAPAEAAVPVEDTRTPAEKADPAPEEAAPASTEDAA